jgi:pyrroloquinoline-quinone synthase
MSFSALLKQELLTYNLLNHPFYIMWNEGKISTETLKKYSLQYLFQVSALPTYISATHSITSNTESRKILTENLADEELNGKDHVSLWKDFCRAQNISDEEMNNETLMESMKYLIETCKKHSSSSSARGFGVLYAQEHNYANIATSKKEGLEKHYNMAGNKEALNFFSVHEKADVWHAQQVETLLNSLPESEQAKAKEAGLEVMKALNGFLDEVLTLEKNTCSH